MKLAMDIAQKGVRPKIRAGWNPALSALISSCWSDDATLRPSLLQVMSFLSMIRIGTHGLIVSAAAAAAKKKSPGAIESEKVPNPLLGPGALWRKIETAPTNVVFGDVLGQGARKCDDRHGVHSRFTH